MLTQLQIAAAKPNTKPYSLSDGEGLSLTIQPTGAKLWRFRYRYGGVAKTLHMGPWPTTSLAEAREKCREARKAIADGLDPVVEKKRAKIAKKFATATTFRAVALEWIAKCEREGRAEVTLDKIRWLLGMAYPLIGSHPIDAITPIEALSVLRKVEERGRYESARRIRSVLSRVFRYGIATARCDRDVAADLRGALTTPKTKHHAAITEPDEVGILLRTIDAYNGQAVTRMALLLSPHLFVRPGGAPDPELDVIDSDVWPEILTLAYRDETAHQHVLARSRDGEMENLDDPVTGSTVFAIESYRQGATNDISKRVHGDPLALLTFLDKLVAVEPALVEEDELREKLNALAPDIAKAAAIGDLTLPKLLECVRRKDTKPVLALRDEKNKQVFSAAEAGTLLDRLAEPELLAKLEAVAVHDRPRLSVTKRVEGPGGLPAYRPRDFKRLSLGQQQSVLLALMLTSESTSPLIVDQPEDNLDSEFIYKTLVPVIRAAKERRQVIVVTHNANIAVLGDAELIITLKATNDKGMIVARGSIDHRATCDLACDILEGSREAFDRRASVYGIASRS